MYLEEPETTFLEPGFKVNVAEKLEAPIPPPVETFLGLNHVPQRYCFGANQSRSIYS